MKLITWLRSLWLRATEPPYRDLAQLEEAYEHDPDDPNYWWGGYPKKWWENQRFCDEIAAEERRFTEFVNAALAEHTLDDVQAMIAESGR